MNTAAKFDKYTDGEYQRKVGEMVDREVIYCVSSLVYELARKDEYLDDLLPLCVKYGQRVVPDQYRYIVDLDERGEYRATVYRIDHEDDETEVFKITGDMFEDGAELEGADRDDHEGNVDYLLKLRGQSLSSYVIGPDDDPEMEDEEDPAEALEHWIVTDWLARKLEERGEMVGEFMGLTIWGRTTSGQAILLDSVICDIYDALHA